MAASFLLFVYGATHPNPKPSGLNGVSPSVGQGGIQSANDADARDRLLRQYEAQHAQLIAALQQCAAQMEEATNQMQRAVMSGEMPVNSQPACAQSSPQWTAQAAFLEAQISRLKTGDTRSLREITGFQTNPSGGPSAYYRPSTGGNDGGESAVESWDRGAIRGTSMYSGENGEQVELPTASYYYRNRETGQYLPSENPNPPNDGYDYERMTPQN